VTIAGRRLDILDNAAARLVGDVATVVSKAALDMFVRCAAIEYARRRIRVNCVPPGYVPTEAMAEAADDALDATLRRATPLGTAGTPADVSNAVAFLASDEAAWITGQVFGVDVGSTCRSCRAWPPSPPKLHGDDVVRAVALPDLTALNRPEEGE
jgi:NAD(P)-dependent dehydrogenase (short-subunit alcohol dehydrogenase family)